MHVLVTGVAGFIGSTLAHRLLERGDTVTGIDTINDYYEDGIYRTPAWHMLGTCRMGSDPEHSVVNKWHQSWEVPNLYVVDGSSFATGGVVNPTSTVCALALRAAPAPPSPPSRLRPWNNNECAYDRTITDS